MKKTLLFAACVCLCLTACQNHVDSTLESETGALSISLSTDGSPSTKSLTDVMGKEATIHDVQLFIFKADGTLYQRETFPENTTTCSVSGVKAGYYQLAALVNAPALTNVGTLYDLQEHTVELSDNNPQVGFVMYGEAENTVMVSGGNTPASTRIELTRFVSRVRLTTVKNNLPSSCGALTVETVLLENGMGTWSLRGSGAPMDFVNHAGRKRGKSTSNAEADFIAVAADAVCASMTFQAPATVVSRGSTSDSFNLPFYCFPNPATPSDDNTGPTNDIACARLVLKISYGSPAESWYYPVSIPGMARNTSYDVSFVISGPGSKDPNSPVTNGNLAVEIQVKAWGDGTSYTGDF